MKIKFVTQAQAIAIHEQQLKLFDSAAGIIDAGKLESALYRPVNIANYNPDATMCELAAALGYGIAIAHPFLDGNTNTAFVIMAVFLEINHVKLLAAAADVVTIMLGIATGTASEKMLSDWLEENIKLS
ncbi:MAG: type II toxin-antitoxin system death-on-curing family toxin [Cyanobacteria bacterium J06623_7]